MFGVGRQSRTAMDRVGSIGVGLFILLIVWSLAGLVWLFFSKRNPTAVILAVFFAAVASGILFAVPRRKAVDSDSLAHSYTEDEEVEVCYLYAHVVYFSMCSCTCGLWTIGHALSIIASTSLNAISAW